METLFTSAAGRNPKVYHLDVERAFLNDKLKEDVFFRPPVSIRNEGKVWKLKKALYGRKQAPKAWNDHVVETLKKLEFRHRR
jgi:putative retroelement pol polyprotein